MTQLAKDYYAALSKLYVYDAAADDYIPVIEITTKTGYVTNDFSIFYTFNGSEYLYDPTAYYDLKEMEEELWTQENPFDDYDDAFKEDF